MPQRSGDGGALFAQRHAKALAREADRRVDADRARADDQRALSFGCHHGAHTRAKVAIGRRAATHSNCAIDRVLGRAMADATLATAPLFDVSLSIGPPEVLPEMMEARIIFEPFYDAAGSSPDCAELLLTEIETKFAVDAYSDAVSTASHSLKGAAGTAGAMRLMEATILFRDSPTAESLARLRPLLEASRAEFARVWPAPA